ncbi:hypothetical protein RDABS01_013607, partial [Bienertia sinuspersici]
MGDCVHSKESRGPWYQKPLNLEHSCSGCTCLGYSIKERQSPSEMGSHCPFEGQAWWDCIAFAIASWVWKAICKQWISQGYSIKSGYQWMVNSSLRVTWANAVWNRYSIPKNRFILWLAIHGRFQNQDRLKQIGITNNADC